VKAKTEKKNRRNRKQENKQIKAKQVLHANNKSTKANNQPT